MNKLKRIFLSRTKDTDTSQDWIQERLEICRKCPFNTDNISDKKIADRLKITANKAFNFIMGKKVTEEATCSVCGCMLIFKTSELEEKCPKGKW